MKGARENYHGPLMLREVLSMSSVILCIVRGLISNHRKLTKLQTELTLHNFQLLPVFVCVLLYNVSEMFTEKLEVLNFHPAFGP
jgi:type III secretory pathway component EscS